jgi:hypothetical protein
MTQKTDLEYWRNKIFPHGNYWVYPVVFISLMANIWITYWTNFGLFETLTFLQYIGKATLETGNELPYVVWGILSNVLVFMIYFTTIFMMISMAFDAHNKRHINRKRRGEL